ncbi:DUF3786 domain-containing protein [Terrisporobacter sp.]
MKVKSNYDIQADKCKLEFIKMDHKKISQKFNLEHDEDYLYIYFFSQKYRLNKKNGNIEKTYDEVNYIDTKYNEVMTLLDLFAYSKEDLSLSNKWINVTHSKDVFKSSGVVNHMDLYSSNAKKFSGKIEKLIKACEKLNGIKINKGDVGYIINVFNFLPIMFIFYEEDSEFSPECKFLWDENILNFMHYETTFYVINHFFERLDELIEI